MLNRRQYIGIMAGATAMTIAPALAQAPAPAGPFKLPALGYPYEALEPHIDAQTMNIHHTRHHQAFITNLNGLAPRWADLATATPESILRDPAKIPEAVRGAVRNNLGGHWNHTFFYSINLPGVAIFEVTISCCPCAPI